MSRIRQFLGLLRGSSGLAAIVQTGVATVLVLAINVATGIISARVLGPKGRGELSALLLGPQFLGYLFTLGLPASMIVKIKSCPASASELMGTALLLSIVMGLLAMATGMLVAPLLLKQYEPHLINVARGLLTFVTLGVISTVAMAALQLKDRFVVYNRVRYWQSAVTLLSLASLAAMQAFTPVRGALGYLLPSLPFCIWILWWVLRQFKPQISGWREHSRSLLSYGWRLHIMDVGNTLFGQLDKIILVALLAPSVFGIYVVVFNLSRLVTTFGNSATPVLLPRSAGKSANEVLSMTSRALTATTLLTLAVVVCFVVLGSLVLRCLYGEQFAAGYWILVILSIEGALSSSAGVLQQPYVVLHRPGTIAIFHIVSLSLATASVFMLARRFGAEGAACGLLLATSVRFAMTYFGFGWVLGVRAPRLVPARSEMAALLNRSWMRAA